MYIYQNGKLYTQLGNGSLVGVEIDSDGVTLITGTETELADDAKWYTPYEVQCKFNIQSGGSYVFPQEQKAVDTTVEGVDENVAIDEVEKPTRKRTRK